MTSVRKFRRHARWLLWPVAALVSAGVVGQASYAAFSAQTSNPGSSLGVGTVALSDDDSGTALFAASNLRPGSTGTRCVAVTSTGTLPSSVKLYATSPATTRALASHVNLTINQGTGGSFASCTGFAAPPAADATVFAGTLASFTGTAVSYATGLGSWNPTGSAAESRTYQISYTVSNTIPDSAQGGTASFGLTWETQNR